MNYYFPYANIPMASTPARTGLLSRIFGNGINWSSILTNAQKALNIVNQTIPVVKQVKPVMNNAKTMFKIMNEFKKVETTSNKKVETTSTNNESKIIDKNEKKTVNTLKVVNNNNPTFFQ